MKRFVALAFIFVLVCSFAACSEQSTVTNTNTTSFATSDEGTIAAQTTPSTQAPTVNNTETPTDRITETPIKGTVAAWYYENKGEVDKYCAENSIITEDYYVKLQVSAEVNTLIFNITMSGMAEAEKQSSKEGAQLDQENWDKQTDEQKAEVLAGYSEDFAQSGIPGMPTPEAVKTVLYDEKGEVVAYTLYAI